MSIRDTIREAQAKVVTKAALAGLKDTNKQLAALGAIVSKKHTLEVLLSRTGDEWTAVTPVTFESKSKLEGELYTALYDRLANKMKNSIVAEYNGFGAYKGTGKFTPVRSIKAQGIEFTIDVIEVDLLPQERKLANTQRGRPRASRIPPLEHPYLPTLEVGQRIEIPLTAPTCLKYTLIPFNSENQPKFPGYRVPFILIDGETRISTYRTSATKQTPQGEMKGAYAKSNISGFYDRNRDLRTGDTIILQVEKAQDPIEYRYMGKKE